VAAIPTSDRELVTRTRLWANGRGTAWLLPALLSLLIFSAVVVEWAYSPIERALGALMFATHDLREEVGRGWELNRESAEALDALGKLADKTRHRRNAGGTLESWEQIPAILDSFQVFSVSPERFLSLYGQLPSALQGSLVDPIDLLRTRSSGDWRRVFFVQERDDYLVYMISADNLVLHQSKLSDSFFERYFALSQPIESKLSDLEQFPLVMDAESFFNTLAPRGSVELDGDDVRWISSLEGELTMIGLASRPVDDLWQIAFETRHGDEFTVYLYWFTEEMGRELADDLQWKFSDEGMGL
jgi:hypothetical protein